MRFLPLTELQLARYSFYDARRKYINKHKVINTLKNRFYAKTLITKNVHGCLLWVGAKKAANSGHLRANRKNLSASRLSYSLFVGNVPDNLDVLHKCDNPQCVRPDHLFLGTHQDNMVDRNNKNRDPMKKGEIYKYAHDNRGEKSGNAKLKDKDAVEIKFLLKKGFKQKDIAEMYGLKQSTISNIKTGKRWSHLNEI